MPLPLFFFMLSEIAIPPTWKFVMDLDTRRSTRTSMLYAGIARTQASSLWLVEDILRVLMLVLNW